MTATIIAHHVDALCLRCAVVHLLLLTLINILALRAVQFVARHADTDVTRNGVCTRGGRRARRRRGAFVDVYNRQKNEATWAGRGRDLWTGFKAVFWKSMFVFSTDWQTDGQMIWIQKKNKFWRKGQFLKTYIRKGLESRRGERDINLKTNNRQTDRPTIVNA